MPFNDFFRRLLGFNLAGPTCSELKRSSRFMHAYQAWVNAQVYLNWTIPFYKAYHFQKAHVKGSYRVQLIEEENRHGAVFFYDPAIGARNFLYLFDLLKDRVLQLGYTLHSSDRHEVRHERYTEQIEKHFLTPPASDLPGTDICNQLYGNILLDYVQVNHRPGYIRLVANSYADAYFSDPLGFTELLEKMLQPTERERQAPRR